MESRPAASQTAPRPFSSAERCYRAHCVLKRVNANVAGTNDNCTAANVDGLASITLASPGGASAASPSGIIVQSDGPTWWIIELAP